MSNESSGGRTGRAKQSWLRRIAPKLLIVLVAVAAVWTIGLIPTPQKEAAVTEAPPVNVTVMPVTTEPQLPDTFDLPSVVEPNRVVTVAAEVPGRIERIGPREGSTIQAGELLIQLNTDLILPQVEMAQAQHERNRIQYERMKALVQTDATSRSDLDDATNSLAGSEARLKEVRANLERTRIVAPISGVLNDLPVEEGEYVQPGTPVAEIVEIDVVKVVVEVPERDIPFFSVGRPAEALVTVRGREQSVTGAITFISEVADPQTRSTRMEITVDNRQGLLRSGQIVQARLTRRILKEVVLIPLLAVIPMENGRAVYVVENGQAQRRQVEIGVIKGDRVQITAGLTPGDQLIVAGHRFVAPGQTVNVVSKSEGEQQP